MAAALRTPSLKYRSFGNEPVRNPLPPAPATEEQAFSILGDALAGANDLPPETVLGYPEPLPTEAPMLPVGDAYATHQVTAPQSYPTAPNPHVELQRAPLDPPPLPEPVVPPAPLPVVPPAAVEAPVVSTHAPPVPHPIAPPPVAHHPATQQAAAPQGQSLLQVLLGGQAPPAFPAAPQAAPPAPPPPIAAPAPAPIPQPVMPAPAAAAPMVPQAPPMPMLAALAAESPSMAPMRLGGSTGSSLLDALMGFGPGAATAAIHYPLLDSLGDAMRGSAGEPSPRHWPAARVDIALPELLRRVAAGVRFARTTA